MQDNPFDEQFMDEAWGEMLDVLDKEMPQERKRRAILWWWLLPLLLLGGFSYWYFQASPAQKNPAIDVLEEPIIAKAEENGPAEESNSFNEITKTETIANVESPTLTSNQLASISSDDEESPERSPSLITENLNESEPVVHSPIDNDPMNSIEQETVGNEIEDANEANNPQAFPNSPKLNSEEKPSVLSSITSFDLLIRSSSLLSYEQIENLPSIKLKQRGGKLPYRAFTLWAEAGIGTQTIANPAVTYSAGLSWRAQKGRFYVRPGLLAQAGNSKLSIGQAGSSTNDLALEAEPAFDPSNPNTDMTEFSSDQSNFGLDFKFQQVGAGLRLGYFLSERISLEGGLNFNYLMQFDVQQNLGELEQNAFTNDYRTQGTNTVVNNFDDLLGQRWFFEAAVGFNYRIATRWEVSANYQFGKNDLILLNQHYWNRNQLSLGLRYRIR